MKIAVPVAQYHSGNTSDYVVRAFHALGHESSVLSREQFVQALKTNEFDRYFCVDSGEVFDFTAPEFASANLTRVSYWFIDYRHHWDGVTRQPGDQAVASELSRRGGWVFQSQYEDFLRAQSSGVENVSFLPLAADQNVWNSEPQEDKLFDVGFVGNIWDRGRADALQILLNQRDIKVGFFGHGALWKEDGAQLLRRSRIGFNVSSYFGTAHAFDVNMRVFETLSCGTPLFTNFVPNLFRLIPVGAPFVQTFKDLSGLLPALQRSLSDQEYLASGGEAAKWIGEHATYEKRMVDVIEHWSK